MTAPEALRKWRDRTPQVIAAAWLNISITEYIGLEEGTRYVPAHILQQIGFTYEAKA
jgi:hypothetical protein